jgi:peroxiredoxin
MNRRRLTSIVLALVIIVIFILAASSLAAATSPVPRKSPEFTISEPSGKSTLLSSFKGKVVVLEFLFIQSDHCMRVAQILNKLNHELSARGFQPVGIVFDPPKVRTSGENLVPSLVDFFKLTYPVGFASKADVDAYLGRGEKEILPIPQVVVIDRAGVIRAVTGAATDPKLEEENSLRSLINDLLKEGASTGPARK